MEYIVSIPDENTLRKRLKISLDFDFETKVIREISNRKLHPIGLVTLINNALNSYMNKYKDDKNYNIILEQLPSLKRTVYEICLQDYPLALKYLEKKGYYHPDVRDDNNNVK